MPADIMFSVKFDDQLTDHEDDGRINHRAQTETMHLEIGNKAPEQFNDNQKRQDVDNNDVEGLPDRPLKKKFLDFIDSLEKAHSEHYDNEQSQYNDDSLKGLVEYYLRIRNFHGISL